jgi:hypothetical protein
VKAHTSHVLWRTQACYIDGLAHKFATNSNEKERTLTKKSPGSQFFAFNNIPWRSQCTASQLMYDIANMRIAGSKTAKL